MNKAYKIRLYPNKKQQELIDKTIGCCRFIYNQMLAEKIKVYAGLKDDKEKLYQHKYKTEKQYKEEFEWLKEASSRGLQQSRNDLNIAFNNFFKGLKKNNRVGFPKFKSKHKSKWSYREPQVQNQVRVSENKLHLLKLGWIPFRGLSKSFNGVIKSVTVIKNRDNTYEASILVEQDRVVKKRKSNNRIGCDLGIKEFLVCSNGESFNGIKKELFSIEKKIKKQSRYLNRKNGGSNRREKCRIKLAKYYRYMTNVQNHYFRHLVKKLCEENQTIVLENLNVSGMLKNRKLSHSIFYSGWGKFRTLLEQKAKEYETEIKYADRFFPSSKTCSSCGKIKKDLSLKDRIFSCSCGIKLDRDLNASINILKYFSPEYGEYKRGEEIRPIGFLPKGIFVEASTYCVE